MGFYDKYFDVPPDVYFAFNVITVLLSILLVYKSIKYYQQIRSIEYLIIAGIFLRFAYSNFVIIRVIYVTNFTVYWINQDSQYWEGYPWVAGWNAAVALADVLLMYHVYHVIDFTKDE